MMKKKTTAQHVGLYIPHSLLAHFEILWYLLGLPTAHFSVFDVVLENGEDDRHDPLLHIFFWICGVGNVWIKRKKN